MAQVAPGDMQGIPSEFPMAVPMNSLEPVFVPADVLLKQADEIQPVTPEGWIVTTRPASVYAAVTAYRDYDYLSRLRNYETQIRLTRVEIHMLEQRLVVYRYFNKTGVLLIDFQNTQLAKLAAEERLRNIRFERMLFFREQNRHFHPPDMVVSREFLDGK